MRIVIVAAECEPWAKVGGLGDVVPALARALGVAVGVDGPVEVFLPRYREIELPAGALADARRLRVPDPYGGGADGVSEVGSIALDVDGYRLRLIDHPPAFDRPGIYGDGPIDHPDNAWRFGLLARAALEALRADGRPVDVLSLHDWHAAPAVLYRDLRYASDPILASAAVAATVHNLAYHGRVPRERLDQLGLTEAEAAAETAALAAAGAASVATPDALDLLGVLLRRADVANTVSPTFAAEAATPAGGHGLDGLVRSLGGRWTGILNGLDTAAWDPRRDRVIAAPYGPGDLGGKAACRSDLLARLGLDPADDGPVVGIIGRLDRQKGFDLVAAALDGLVGAGGRVVALGSGDAAIATAFRQAASAHPGQVVFEERFDRDLARRIYAGADCFLMPSRFEPCGLGQLIALRYGTPPIVRRTGGLADTVVDADERPGEGTGFVFDEPTPEALLGACRRAFDLRSAGAGAGVPGGIGTEAATASGWSGLIARGMRVDHSWERASAPRYVELYRRAISRARGGAPR